jgi:hypothetical protein
MLDTTIVAQIFNLLYRGFPNPRPLGLPAPAGLETSDTAGLETCATTAATNPPIH